MTSKNGLFIFILLFLVAPLCVFSSPHFCEAPVFNSGERNLLFHVPVAQTTSAEEASGYTPLAVQFPCDVTIQCDALDDLKHTGNVHFSGGCGIAGAAYSDETFVVTDACYKIKRTWIVKSWCSWEPDSYEDYYTTQIQENLNQITFSSGIDSLIFRRSIAIGDRVTLEYVTSGQTEIPGLIEGDIYSFTRISDSTFQVTFNTTKQEVVNITGQGIGPHLFRYTNSELGLPITCDVLQSQYPFGAWDLQCCNGSGEQQVWVDDGDGYFKFTQVIKVIDNIAPEWLDCSDTLFCNPSYDCAQTFIVLMSAATDLCTPSEQLSYSYQIDLDNNGTVDRTGVGNDGSGLYAMGQHKAIFKVTDRCGNWNTCTKYFTIRDCAPPTSICIDHLSVSLMPSPDSGSTAIWAKSIEAGESYDNCTSHGDLIILVERLSAITAGQMAPGPGASDVLLVDCNDLPPLAPTPFVDVVVWTGDAAGNWDYCVTAVEVQDNMGACSDSGKSMIINQVYNEKHEGIDQTALILSGSMMDTTWSNVYGYAGFVGLPLGEMVHIKPFKKGDPLNGVSTLDVHRILQHILGIKQLQSSYQRIAGDVNNNGIISWSDVLELQQLILDPAQGFKQNTSWRFVDANYVFSDPLKIKGYPESKTIAALTHGMTPQFIGIKIGDVTGDAVPNSLLESESRNENGVLTFGIIDQNLVAGKEFTIAISANNFQEIKGYQYTLECNPGVVELVRVDPIWTELSVSNFGFSYIDKGMLTTSWSGRDAVSFADGDELFTMTIRAKTNAVLSQACHVSSRVTKAEAYTKHEEIMDVEFRFDPALEAAEMIALYQNEPNPCAGTTSIGFTLPEATTATLKIIDLTGKVLKMIHGQYDRGYHTISLDCSVMQGSGVLYYQLDTPKGSATKRIVIME